jgi:hypothetical protein
MVGGLLLVSLVVCCVGEVMAYGWLVRQVDMVEDVGAGVVGSGSVGGWCY